ncbi:MAG: hypothetical protein ACI9VR_003124 [Cognaticolwellia sp.]
MNGLVNPGYDTVHLAVETPKALMRVVSKHLRSLLLPVGATALLVLAGCGLETFNETGVVTESGPAGDADTDADGDSDSDADADGDGDSDTDSDTDTDMSISGLTPDWGTTAGGTVVTLNGTFTASSGEVLFGTKAGSVQNWSTNSISVSTPSQSTAGLLDITVKSGSNEVVETEAFTTYQDATGQASVLGTLNWWDYNENVYESGLDFGDGSMFMNVPLDIHWWELYAASEDSCSDNFVSSKGLSVYSDFEVSQVQLKQSTRTVTMSWQEPNLRWYGEYTSSQLGQGSAYDLQSVNSAVYPTFSIADAARGPKAFTVTSPAAVTGAFQSLSRTGLNFSWSASGADAVMINIVVTPTGDFADAVHDVTCWAKNDGSFTVPSSLFSQWGSGSIAYLIVGAAKEGTGTNPIDNGDARVAGVYWRVSAAQTR